MSFTNFILSTNNPSAGLLSKCETSEESNSLLSSENQECLFATENENDGFDAFGGKDIFGTPDFSNMDENLFANAFEIETAGSVAYSVETAGSVAYNSSETAGSIACTSSDAGSCSSFNSFC